MMNADSYVSLRVSAGPAHYDLARELESFNLDDDATKPSQLDVTISDAFRVLSHAVREGMTVEVELGSISEHSRVFRGRIHQVESDFPRDAAPKLRLVAHDERMRMGLRQRSRRFLDQTLSEIVRQVAGAYFSDVEIELTGDPSFDENGVRQVEQTDLEFLLALAEEFECELLLDESVGRSALRFVSSSRLRNQSPALTLHHGRSGVRHLLASFRPKLDLARVRLPHARAAIDADTGEETGVFVRRASPALEVRDDFASENMTAFSTEHPTRSAELAALLAAADASARTFQEEIGTRSFGSGAAFLSPDQRAAHERQEVSRELLGMQAQATVDGVLSLRPASVIRIQNVGARFSGNWYVLKVRHVLDQSGRRTELECER